MYLFLFKNSLIAQTNLIKNSSFETYTLPVDCNGGGFDNASVNPITHVVDNWYTFHSPDYFNSICNVSTSVYNVPNNLAGISYAKTGNAYAGMYVYKKTSPNDLKEYIYQQLNAVLEADSVYCLSFFVTRADRIPFAIKDLSAYFSLNTPTITATGYISAIPQVTNQNGFITDTIGWTEVKGCFIAQGGEQYITIGNFKTNTNTDTLRIQSTNPLTGIGTDVAYYYIDSVSLWKNNLPTTINEFSMANELNIYPNPTNNQLNVSSKNIIQKIEVTNTAGQLLLYESVNSKTYLLNLNNLTNGIYFIRISYSNGLSVNEKIIVRP